MDLVILGKFIDFYDLETTIDRIKYGYYNISSTNITVDDILNSDIIYKNDYLKDENKEDDLSEDYHSIICKTHNGQWLHIFGRECERAGYDCGCQGSTNLLVIEVKDSLKLLIDSLKDFEDFFFKFEI